MNGIVILSGLALFVAGFCLLPWLALLVSRRFCKRSGKLLFLGVLLIQMLVCARIAQHPAICFAAEIPEELSEKKADWVRETLVRPYGGFYSSRLPLLAYRFHVTTLSDDHVTAEVYYLPKGSIVVEWDRAYGCNITRSLR